jgi:N-acetylglucosaminyl-diphospho-decaprenol L-rhamnosyltransferase
MDLGIVIVNWNVRLLLAACLDSVYQDLAQSAAGLQGQVCVVDNGSTDGSVEMLRARFPDLLFIQSENIGMGAGNNVGLRALGFQPSAQNQASAPEKPPFAALILNPDTVVRPGALRALVDFLRARPRAGVAAPKLLNSDDTLQHSGFRFPGFTQMTLDLFPLPGRLQRLTQSPLNGRYLARAYTRGRPFRVDHALGAAFAVRADAIAQCGLFDETFHMYCEEIDWQWRMAKAGWERWIVPSAEIVHYSGQSTSQAPARASALLHLWKSRRELYARYHSPAYLALLSPLVRWAMRRRLRQSQRADLSATLAEIIYIWQAPPTARQPTHL